MLNCWIFNPVSVRLTITMNSLSKTLKCFHACSILKINSNFLSTATFMMLSFQMTCYYSQHKSKNMKIDFMTQQRELCICMHDYLRGQIALHRCIIFFRKKISQRRFFNLANVSLRRITLQINTLIGKTALHFIMYLYLSR